MDSLYLLIGAVGGLIAGGVAIWLIIKSMARSRAKTIVEEAQLEADMLKKNKLLEIKEEEMNHSSKQKENHGLSGLKNKNMKQLNIILAMEKV